MFRFDGAVKRVQVAKWIKGSKFWDSVLLLQPFEIIIVSLKESKDQDAIYILEGSPSNFL